MNEQQKVKRLVEQGYQVECINPGAKKFSHKYQVYQTFNFGNIKDRRTAIVNENGEIIGSQG